MAAAEYLNELARRYGHYLLYELPLARLGLSGNKVGECRDVGRRSGEFLMIQAKQLFQVRLSLLRAPKHPLDVRFD